MALESLAAWLAEDPGRIEPQLEAGPAVARLTAVFKGHAQSAPSEAVLRVLEPLLRILKRSRRITVRLPAPHGVCPIRGWAATPAVWTRLQGSSQACNLSNLMSTACRQACQVTSPVCLPSHTLRQAMPGSRILDNQLCRVVGSRTMSCLMRSKHSRLVNDVKLPLSGAGAGDGGRTAWHPGEHAIRRKCSHSTAPAAGNQLYL